jgi:polar amino acid transport system substrate-binding protein
VSRSAAPWRGRSILLAFALAGGLAVCAEAEDVTPAPPSELRACDGNDEFPPFSYFRHDAHGTTVVGFAVDVATELLAASGRTLRVDLIPWSRCLEAAGKGAYDFVLSARKTAERDVFLAYPTPYASMRPIYVYDRRHPMPPVLDGARLAGERICGLFGYSYDDQLVQGGSIDRGAKSLAAAAAKLRAGRCDLFLTTVESRDGARLIADHDIFPTGEFGSATLAGAAPTPIYMPVSRTVAYSAALVELLSRATEAMQASGEADRLAQRYLPHS